MNDIYFLTGTIPNRKVAKHYFGGAKLSNPPDREETPNKGTVRGIAHVGLPFPHIGQMDEENLLDSFTPAGAFFEALGLTCKIVDLSERAHPGRHDRNTSRLRVHVTRYGNPKVLFSFTPTLTLTSATLMELVGPSGYLCDLHLAINVAPAELTNAVARLHAAGHEVEYDTNWGPGHHGVHVTGPWGYCFELQVSNGIH